MSGVGGLGLKLGVLGRGLRGGEVSDELANFWVSKVVTVAQIRGGGDGAGGGGAPPVEQVIVGIEISWGEIDELGVNYAARQPRILHKLPE